MSRQAGFIGPPLEILVPVLTSAERLAKIKQLLGKRGVRVG